MTKLDIQMIRKIRTYIQKQTTCTQPLFVRVPVLTNLLFWQGSEVVKNKYKIIWIVCAFWLVNTCVFYGAIKHENDVNNMVGCLQVLRIYSFVKTLFSMYASILLADTEEKEKFYSDFIPQNWVLNYSWGKTCSLAHFVELLLPPG